jgi:small conductance mechanosensitive channel
LSHGLLPFLLARKGGWERVGDRAAVEVAAMPSGNTTVLLNPFLPDLPDWADKWIPMVAFLALIPVTRLVFAIIRRVWLAGITKVPIDRQRARQRIETVLSFVRSVIYFALALLALMYGLRAVFPNFDPATATGALSILALVLTGMFRDVVVDVVKGLDILFGGHYAVGDYIRVGNYSGYVVDFQLKYTKLRSAGGEEIVLNNASCIPSRRFPRGWVSNFVDIPLANPQDQVRAKEILDSIGDALIEMVEQVKEKPSFQLAHALPDGGLVLRYSIKVLPGADWVINDRYLPVIRSALQKAEIPLARDISFFFMNDVEQFRDLFGRGGDAARGRNNRRRGA